MCSSDLAVCLSCLTMTGCSALNFSVEGLINAPKLSSEQSEIHQALIESVGSNITLKYPENGEYRSASANLLSVKLLPFRPLDHPADRNA